MEIDKRIFLRIYESIFGMLMKFLNNNFNGGDIFLRIRKDVPYLNAPCIAQAKVADRLDPIEQVTLFLHKTESTRYK